MTPVSKVARDRLTRAEIEVENARNSVTTMEKFCPHQFGPVEYNPVRREAYDIQGDPPGTMGVDRQMGMHVPASTTSRWTRTCRICGMVQHTTKTDEKVTRTPKF